MPSMEKPLAQMSIPESQKKENVLGKSFPYGFSSNSPVFFFFSLWNWMLIEARCFPLEAYIYLMHYFQGLCIKQR